MLASYDYDAFGNQKNVVENIYNPFRYNGEYADEETGLIYLRARYYEPSSGRFISEDPAKDGLNWYAYCGGNPVNFVDPLGLKRVVISGVPAHKQTDENEYRYNIYYYRKNYNGEPGELLYVYQKQYRDKNGNNVRGANLCWASATINAVEYYTGDEYFAVDVIKATKRSYNSQEGYVEDVGYSMGKSFELADYVCSQVPGLTYENYSYSSNKNEEKISFNLIKEAIDRGDVVLVGTTIRYANGKEEGHFITVTGYDDDPGHEMIVYNDPAYGREREEGFDPGSYTSVIIFDSTEVKK